MDSLTAAFYDVMYQYRIPFTPEGVAANLAVWYENKAPLDDLTLNLLVPEQYHDMEQEILAAWREYFYFEKVEAENDYNERAGEKEQLDIAENQLTVNIIYVKDGQRYFTYRSDCASADGSWITDPLVQIYTGNRRRFFI